MTNITIIIPSNKQIVNISSFFKKHEVVVVFDGVDGDVLGSSGMLGVYKIKKSGPAACRNYGVKKAKGDILLFLGDDVILSKNLIEEHRNYHEKNMGEKDVVLGYLRYPKCFLRNPLCEYLENSGTQFNYGRLWDGKKCDYRCFYSSNLSIKKSFFEEEGGFDKDFKYPTYEDTELGYRLSQKGMKMVFNEKAVGLHVHKISFVKYCLRMIKVGKSARLLEKKHPELKGKVYVSRVSFQEWIRFGVVFVLFPFGYLFRIKKIYYPFYSSTFKFFSLLGYNG